MNNQEINRRIAEFMGLCWHSFADGVGFPCILCGARYLTSSRPEYTSPDSPRRLLDEAQDRACEQVGTENFHDVLAETVPVGVPMWKATPEQICLAIIACLDAGKEVG